MLWKTLLLFLFCVVCVSSDASGGWGGPWSGLLSGPVGAADYILFISGGNANDYNTKTNAVDYSGTDTGAVLNSVVGALSSGGRIFALEGTYNVTTPVFFNTGVVMRCASWTSNFVEQSGMTGGSAIFQIGSVSSGAAITDTEISDCKITGRQSDVTEHIIGVGVR